MRERGRERERGNKRACSLKRERGRVERKRGRVERKRGERGRTDSFF